MAINYLVFIRSPHMEPASPNDEFCRIMTAQELFNRMDMDDCTDETVEAIFRIREGSPRRLTPCRFKGTWHNLSDPLCMAITTRKGEIIEYGHGTDH